MAVKKYEFVGKSSEAPCSELNEITALVSFNIAKARRDAHKKQSEVAEALGVSIQSISQWERGQTDPKHETLGTLAKLLKLPGGGLWFYQKHEESKAPDWPPSPSSPQQSLSPFPFDLEDCLTDQEVRILKTLELKEKKGLPLNDRERAFLDHIDEKVMGVGGEGLTKGKPDFSRLDREADAFVSRCKRRASSSQKAS